jgi:choice-of-anchor C domain-containing protein
LKIVTFLFVLTAFAVLGAKANLLVNGSFELGPRSDGLSIEPISAGSTDIVGWVVSQGSIDWEGTDGWDACEGVYSLDLNGSDVGGIEQTFATVSSRVYNVTFCMAGNPSVSALMTMHVEAGDQFVDFAFNTSGRSRPDIGWVTNSWSFTASDAETTLRFLSTFTGSSFEGAALDDVVVTTASVPCEITCPDDVIVNVEPEAATTGTVVTYDSASTTGDCGPVSSEPASGSVFPVGTTPVTCSVGNAEGGVVTCTFNVTVVVVSAECGTIAQLIEEARQTYVNGGQKNSLIVKLVSAQRAMDRGEQNEAGNTLRAFVHQVEAFERAGVLSAETGDALIDCAQKIISGLQLRHRRRR